MTTRGHHLRRACLRVAALALASAGPALAQHSGDMLVGQVPEDGNRLAILYDFASRVAVSCSFGACQGAPVTDSLYSTTDPGWDAVVHATGGVAPLPDGTPVVVEITAIDPGVSLRIGPTTLNAPGQSRTLGVFPSIHVHPSWQLTLPGVEQTERAVSFKLTTSAAGYAESVVYTAVLSNTTTTTSSTIAGSTSTTTTFDGISTTTSTLVPGPSTTTTTGGPRSPTTSTTLPPRGDLLRGASLVLRTGRARATLTVVSRDPNLTLGDDPTLHGAALRLAGASGGFDAVHVLPTRNWRAIRRRGAVVGWRYADPKGTAGPLRSLTLRAGKRLELSARGAALGVDLASDPVAVTVTLVVGAHRWCLRFGGRISWKPGASFAARGASPPPVCAP